MTVAAQCRVTLRVPAAEVGRLLADLLKFGRFHPSTREGLVQVFPILALASRAEGVYGRAREVLADLGLPKVADRPVATPGYGAPAVGALLDEIEGELATITRDLPLATDPADRRTLLDLLYAIERTALEIFHELDRVRALPGETGTVTIEGFVPTASVEELKRALGPSLLSAEPVLRRGPEDPYVPTLLVNPRSIALFEKFIVDRGIPKYTEIDPTPIVAFVFPLFFGIMFGDVGHGLTMFAFGLYLWRATSYAYWGRLIVVFGIAAAIVGALRGVFFGVTFETPLGPILSLPTALKASLTFSFVPLLLEVAVLVGTFHLASAYAISVANQVRSGRYAEVAFLGAPTLLLYASAVPFGLAILGTGLKPATLFSDHGPTPFFNSVLGWTVPDAVVAEITLPLIAVSLLLLFLGPPVARFRTTRNRRKRLRALWEGVVCAVSRPLEFGLNTISYVRLAALLITNTLLAGLIARALAYGVAGILLAGVLNLLLMAMEGIVVYLQDMRLHWLEWLPKFYSGTGTAYDPIHAPPGLFEGSVG